MAVLLSLAGGLLYGAVSMDILPAVVEVEDRRCAVWPLCTVFSWSTVRCQQGDENEDAFIESFHGGQVPAAGAHSPLLTTPSQAPSRYSRSRRSWQPDGAGGDTNTVISVAQSLASASKLTRAVAAQHGEVMEPKANIPFVLAACIDCFIDGFFIGSLIVNEQTAGWIVAGASAVESTFLAITVTLQCASNIRWAMFAMIVPALTLVSGGTSGAALKSIMNSNTPLYVGFLSFGMGAILFMVGQELLREAFERAGHGANRPWFCPPVAAFVLIGFGIVFIMSQTLPHGEH
eukprot:TRINITY_DN67810_c10_g1_i3.p1 TRINITY_DN67810_c10_g1~~TRINITY_DN67810_c10_g1_i3.p1  ORF type:complete len:290 (-),score=10.53 TRINITY_DN67810_c10_g1_i3:136-1005(-)